MEVQSEATQPQISNVHIWILDLENSIKENWNDDGRIELAKQHVLDRAYIHLTHCVLKHAHDWKSKRLF